MIVSLFVNRPAAWGLAIASGIAISCATAFVSTVGQRPLEALSPTQRHMDVFLRAFLGAAWSGYSNYASKAVVEVIFSSVHAGPGDWRRPELYLFALVMAVSLFMQVRCACACEW